MTTATPNDIARLSHNALLLCERTRLRLLHRLLNASELNVGELVAFLKIPQPSVSHHLGLLRRAGFVSTRRSGKNIFYRPEREAITLAMSEIAAALSHPTVTREAAAA